MAGQTITEMRQEVDSQQFVRKIRRAVAFACRKDETDLPTQITTDDHKIINFKELGWFPFGLVSRDGYEFGRDIEKSQVDALGYGDPIRRDTENVARSITLQLLETGRRHIHELIEGADYSGIRPKENGEVVWDEPDLPLFEEYRLAVIGEDGRITDNWLMGKGYGAVELGSAESISWNQESAVAQSVTLDVNVDPAIGSPVRNYLGGSALGRYVDVLGWTGPEGGSGGSGGGSGED